MEERNTEICPADQDMIDAEEAILSQMEKDNAYDIYDPPTPGGVPSYGDIDKILATSGVHILDTDMDISQIKMYQSKLVSDIGKINVEMAKYAKELSEVELIINTYKGNETIRVAHEESVKPGHASHKTGRALSNTQQEYQVESSIRDIVLKNTPGYDIIQDKMRIEGYLNRIERALKNIDRQAMLLSSMAKIGTEQERFGNTK